MAVQGEVTAMAAVCRTAVKNTAVAVATVTVVTAEAAEAGTAAAESMVWTTTLPSEKTKECKSNGRQVHPCHFLTFPSSVVSCSGDRRSWPFSLSAETKCSFW
jgi:hypothetical protein